jgi:superfamily II DNA/RNA helicase
LWCVHVHTGEVAQTVLSYCKSFSKPTPIQAQSWPALLMGGDGICIAKVRGGAGA